MSHYVIITESGGDIPQSYLEKYDIRIVPMHVAFNGKSYDDKSFPTSQIFEHYAKTKELPVTSGSMPNDFQKVFDEIWQEDPSTHVIYLAYSSITTCSFGSAKIIAGEDNRVTFIDTKSVTAGQHLVVTEVAEYISQNPHVTPAEITTFANDLISRIEMSFIPGGLEFLKAGGRLSNTAFLGATLLRIKPVIEIKNGALVATDKLRGNFEKVLTRMISNFLAANEWDKKRVACINVYGLSQECQNLAETMLKDAGFETVEWVDAGGVISSHCGPGSFGLAAFRKN